MTTKTYTRKTSARAAITANPDLTPFSYDIEQVSDNPARFAPVFHVATAEEGEKISALGFRHYPISKDAPKMPEAKTLDQKAMLASLSVKGWSGRVTDLMATDDVLMRNQATEGWGKFTKRLVAAEAVKDIKAAEAATRKAHKELTLPWDEKGFRVLPSAAWQDYSQRIGDARAAWTAAVDRLLNNYSDVIEDARRELGGLFNESDYPDVDDLREKYTFDAEVKALDVKGDFRVQIGDQEIQRLQGEIKAATEARLAHAMSDVYRRLHEVVSHMAARLRAFNVTEDGKRENPFRDATLQNVQDIVSLMPALNLTGDPALTDLTRHVQETLLAADAKELREDKDTRERTAKAAEEIADAMAGMM